MKFFLRKYLYLLLLAYCLLPVAIQAQDTLDNSLEQKLENLTETSQNEEADYTSLIELTDYYKKHPINLNKAIKTELTELGLLDELQIENLLTHIEKNGKLISIYELQGIDGFDIHTIEKILSYVTVTDVTEEPHATLKEIIANGNHVFILRGQQILEQQKGFLPIDSAEICNNPNSRYIGSPEKIYSRYRFNYGSNVSAGITAEKDAGEFFFKKNRKHDYPYYDSLLKGKQKEGFDFYSAHFFLKNARFIKALAIGDYQISFGQGLTAWSGLAYGKGSDAVNIKRYSTGIRSYTSADENRFMRGAAFTAGSKIFQATGFFSRKKVDANIILSDSLNTAEEVSSLQTTGLHTTPSEIADKHAITQTIAGGNLSYRKRKYSLGVTGIHTLFDTELNRSLSTYNQFEFSGKQLANIGTDYSILLHNFNFFGEISISSSSFFTREQSPGAAFLNGCIISFDPKLSFSVLHRSFQRNYQSLSANAFAESSTPANEQGVYLGITAKPVRSITVNAYYDHFNFPWLKYQINAPSSGNEFLVQVNYTPSKKFDAYVRLKQKDKFVNNNSSNEIDFLSPHKQMNYRWHVGYQISPAVKFRNRIEYIAIEKGQETSNKAKEAGYLIYQDAIWKKPGSKISLTLRYALFDTKSYESRIYAYETDIPGSYSIPSYYYKGSRTYLMVNWDITRSLELWLRWSQTYYSNKNIISEESLNEIQGNSKSEMKVQMRLKF